MKQIQTLLSKLDSFQQRHAALAFPVAVVKRYGDDKAGRLAALVAYYAFLSLFPLLLVFITVLNIFISNNPQLETRIISTTLQYFPALADSLRSSVHTITDSGLILLVELMALFYGARGLAIMLQESFNNVWHVDEEHRPGFAKEYLRSFGMMAAVGFGIIIGTLISYTAASIFDIGVIGQILVALLNLALTIGLFLAVFRLGTSSRVALRSLVLGAIIAGTGAIIVQHFGGLIMSYQLPKLQSAYGTFAFALAMLFWIYLQAQVILYALVATAVRVQHDWPKKLT